MATLNNGVGTLAEWAKRQDASGAKTAKIIETLNQTNRIIDDAIFVEGNLPTGHRTTMRTSLPTVGFRALNSGVTPSRSTTKQSDEACGKIEGWAECDVALANLNGDAAAYRLSEAKPFLEAMNQTFGLNIFYGNQGLNQAAFTGFAPRYSSISSGTTKANVISATASPSGSDQTSIWLVVWSENTVHCIYPKGSQAGLQHKDLGEETAETVAGLGQTRMRVYRDQFIWDVGIAVRDPRYVVRAANVDTSALVAQSGNADLVTVMSRMLDRVPQLSMGKPVFYMSRTPQSWLRVQALGKSSNAVTVEPALNQFGQRIGDLSFLGVPIRTCDQISEAEAIVS